MVPMPDPPAWAVICARRKTDTLKVADAAKGVVVGTFAAKDSDGLLGAIQIFWVFYNHLPLLSFAMTALWSPSFDPRCPQ
jgi:hypothetical protein